MVKKYFFQKVRRVVPLLIAALFCVPVFAEPLGKMASTDIITYISGVPIESYNFNGSTCIKSRDLALYGYYVIWKEESRAVQIERVPDNVTVYYPDFVDEKTINRSDFYYDVLPSDIKTYIEGTEVESYNVNGETYIKASDLGLTGTVKWNPDERKVGITPNKK